MEDNNSQSTFLDSVIPFYWFEQKDRPWEISDVGPPKCRSRGETTTLEHVLG
jgi:hypothetical protein